jgi:NADPH:quinone reductase-like Zn-dependent oxidoreductase
MRALAILGNDARRSIAGAATLRLEGIDVHVGFVDIAEAAFDPTSPASAGMVKLQIRGFACNYRDRALILAMAVSPRSNGFYVIGSDFVATVLEVGPGVDDLRPGDRVIPNDCWLDSAWPGAATGLRQGIPDNHGSREIQVLPRAKLLRIPGPMADEVAAGFSICAQTAYSMVRRLALRPDDRVLLTAPHSSTSLFALSRLSALGVEVHGLASNDRNAEELASLGLKRRFVMPPAEAAFLPPDHPLVDEARRIGGYRAIIDPFCDIYLPWVLPLLGAEGKYITCGLQDQHTRITGATGRENPGLNPAMLLGTLIVGNLSIIGNCLGTTADLQAALDDHAAGRFPVVVDQVFHANQPAAFLARSFLDRGRFGRTCCMYAD